LTLNSEAGALMRKRATSRGGRGRREDSGLANQALLDESVQTQNAVGPQALQPSLSIVIPAKNEARNLPRLFARLPKENCEVILVDGASTDGTVSEALRLRPDVMAIVQTRKGKGNALACGFAAASGSFIVMIDADGSNDPAEIPRFVSALKAGADFAKGSRFLAGGGSQDISFVRRVGNFWLNKIVNLLYGTRYTDLCYGYNAFRRECLGVMALDPGDSEDVNDGTMQWGDGFEVETLINVRIAKANLRVAEVPSFEAARHFGSSNLNAFSDGIRVLRTIHAERNRRVHQTSAETAEIQPEGRAPWPLLSGLDEEVS